jgi:hypothetical protein
VFESGALESAARRIGSTILLVDVRSPNDIEGAFATMARNRASAFLILGGGLTYSSRQQIAELAVQHRLPGIHVSREYAGPGCSRRTEPTMKPYGGAPQLMSTRSSRGPNPAICRSSDR